MSGGALGLVTNEQNVVPLIPQHGLEVIDDATAAAHAATGDDDGWACSLGQMMDDALMITVAVYCNELFEGQRAASGLDAFAGLFVPEGF